MTTSKLGCFAQITIDNPIGMNEVINGMKGIINQEPDLDHTKYGLRVTYKDGYTTTFYFHEKDLTFMTKETHPEMYI